ncbi:MAG: YggS family pyridoxal phosphate-dependent enzyme [Clostridia bacterium]|nr:YggS family pyridoxal phosphate-dependent enzyme [Clostridia bacterium]
MSIIDNYLKIKEQINMALDNSRVKPRNVSLIVVTKGRSIEEINEIINQKHYLLGENRVQELREKYPQLPSQVEWHLIGHLQRNKVKYITDKVKLIHSLESFSLAQEINKRMESLQKTMECLVQVNIAGEASKFGLSKEETLPFIKEVAGSLPWVKIKGLMNIAPEVENPEEVRPYFREMYQLFNQIKEANIPNVEMAELSMGMTNDFQVAIEEGATMVRVGSAIFGPRY